MCRYGVPRLSHDPLLLEGIGLRLGLEHGGLVVGMPLSYLDLCKRVVVHSPARFSRLGGLLLRELLLKLSVWEGLWLVLSKGLVGLHAGKRIVRVGVLRRRGYISRLWIE